MILLAAVHKHKRHPSILKIKEKVKKQKLKMLKILKNIDSKITQQGNIPVRFIKEDGNYLFNVNNRNTRTRCEIC